MSEIISHAPVDVGVIKPARPHHIEIKDHHNHRQSDGNASFLRAARAGNLEKVLEYLKGSIDINTSNANGLNALHLASKEGHVPVVSELVKRGANVNAATKKGNTALHIASLAGQEEVVKILVRNGANVNVQSQNGFTPLYMAAQENHDAVVKFLLANGANQSLATEDGFTPLAVALQQGHDKVVAVLLENDAKGRVRLPALHIAAKKDDCKAAALLLQNDHDPDVTSKSGFTPLHIAAHYGNENIGKLLLEKNADVNYSAKHQITPLHVAAKWGKSNMVNLLVDKGAKIDASTRDGLTPLHCAARSGHEQVVDLLLEKGAPITAKTKNGLAPLHMASQGDHVDGSRILLYHKAPVDDVTVDYLTALHVAAHCGHVRVAKLLLDRKADPNARALNGFTPLHIACKKNRIKVVELLLKHGASIEATTESGLTPLHVASFMGCMNIVIYLIQHGANPDVPTVRGETPLHLAARANQSDIIRILLRNGAHVDASAREHQTPLHIAARLGNVDIVGLLLQHGAAVDATTKDMYTALHIAAKEGQEEVASVLLDHGASLTATTKKGFTPLHLAAKYGNIKVARLLLQKDAPVDAQGKNGVTPLHVAAHYDHVNVALLLLDKGAYPHATAKNGYTPLHIAAKKNQMDIATTLLEYGAKPNAESKAGFNPLHLAAQEGHTDMTTLLIEHHADVNTAAKNGLTPLHLCAQEDRVNVAAILVKTGAEISLQTKAGYSPLHVACHFGQINMIRFLLQHGADVNATTSHGYTPLHQAAQQGHTLIINLLLEHKASPNSTTNQGQTALSIAQRLGYISVVETLKIVTETVVTTTTTTITEEKYKVVAPETMQETFMSDSEDEGGDDIEDTSLYGKPAHATHVYLPYIEGQRYMMTEDTMLGDQSFRYLTADEMKSLGDDSLPIDVTRDERGADSILIAPLTAEEEHLTPQHIAHQEMTFTSTLVADNVDISRAPVHAGFLVSFMVDARGGAMRGCRHSGVRVIIPPRKAPMPMRITCRYLRKEKLAHPPPLMEGEACASRILEVGPAGAKFLGPVIIEVPHFAALRGREREITILRSDNGETWREHLLEASDDAVHDVFNESFEGEDVTALEDLNTNRITRILTTDFPQYFAIITRIRQEVHAIGPEGGVVSSTVVPQVQAIFPEGALTKKIKVGLQAHPITPELVTKLLGNRVAVSPIVTVEPRRRKFHKPITLTIPVPQAATKGMINQYSGDAPTLRLLCSITGGTTKAQWEDVTGSTPLTFVNDCVSFTTTVSARFWLMDCRQVNEATKFATELYREAIHVPFMAKFVVFAKRHDPMEAQLRVFCMTDDKEDKTLECQEHFTEVAKSRDVEVLEAKSQFLEFVGNLIPVTKSGEQLKLTFQAFRENRLPFTIRVKDQNQEPLGRVAFMREPRVGRGEPPQSPICNLNISLPEAQITPVSELVTLEKKYGFVEETGLAKPELIHRADLRLSDIASELREDWIPLALQLDIPESDINSIRSEHKDNVTEQALKMLRTWLQKAGNKATGNSLEKGLRKINREDIVNQCMINVELVTDDVEKAVAKVHLDQSGFDTFKEELGSSRDASLRRETSLNGTFDEQDIMKEAESAAETSSEGSDKETHYHLESKQTTVTAVELLEMGKETLEDEIADQIITMPSTEKMCFEVNHSLEEKEKVISEMNSKDLNNGQHTSECIIYEEEKSDLTSATVSSENTAEFEVLSSEDKPRTEVHTKKKEWTETDDSGSIRQVTQIKTETSITLSGEGTERIHDFKSENELPSINEQLSDAEEEMLSFVEKRNFFQRLSLTSEMLPLNSKWTQEVSLDDIPMAQGEIVKEQISFEDKLKMFEPDEDKRKKAQKRDKHEQPTVYRYDFTKPNKDRKSAAELAVSELDKAEQIVKQVNNVLNEEECRLMIRNQDSKVENLLANRFESAFTLENIEHEVSSLLAEVDKEEKELSQKDIIVERGLKAKKPSSLECKTGTSYSDYVDYNEGLDASCEIASYLDSTVKTPETLLSLSTQSEEMTCEDLRLSGIAHETESHHLKHCSGGEMESTTKNLEEIKSCSVSIPLEYVTPEQLSSVQELQERKSPLSHTMNMSSSSKESEHSITLFEQETPFSESQFKNVGQRDESGCEIDKYTKNKKFCDLGTLTFPPQHFDISEKFNSHIKTQILHEELDQSLEESPLEVKHIAEDIEHLLASSPCQTKDVMKQIRTEIFSQELGEDIESGSPEKKNIILDALEKEAGEPRSEVIEVEDKSYVSNNDSETRIIASQGEIISQRLQAVEDIAITDSSMSRSFEIDTFSHQDVNVEFCESEISHQDFVPVKISQCPFDNDVLSSGNNLVERDDYLKEYEEAKEEHSLSEQLLALASDVRRTSKCLDDDEIFSESCSSHMGFEHNLGSIHSQSETEKHRRLDTDVKYSRADKKEMRLLKSTKQVSTIEEHSSVESNDSSQELVQAEVFSPDIVPEVMILKETSEVCDVMLDSKEEFQVEKYGKGEDVCDQTVNESICFSNAVEDLPIVGNSILSREHVDINADKNSQETEFHIDPKEYFSSKDMFKDYKKNDSDAESVKSDDKKWDSDAEVVKIDDKRSDSDAECVRTDGELTPTQRKEESFSSSGETESPYYSVETSGYERTPHSTPAASRPCSSEFEVNILSGQGSEYETCATSQDVSGEVSGSYATAATSQETSYSTACSSLSHSSRESAYSVDSESSGHLGSIEVSSEASETLVPSAQEMELEFGQDIDVTVLDEDSVLIENAIKEPYDTYIPESVIRSGIELPFMKNWDMHKSSIEHHARQLSNHWNLHDAREEESLNCLSERREECKSNSSDALTVLDKKYKCELGHQIDYQGMNLTTNSSSDDHQGMHLTTNSSSDDHQGESDSLQFKKKDILKETEGKEENVLFDIGNIHDHSENIDDDQCYSATIETNQEKNVSDHIDEDPPSMSESSATHSEQTWQTSSADTAFHIPSSIPSSYFPLGGQNSVTLDSLPDKSNVKCTSEHSLPLSPKSKFINPASSYLQLNGPVEVDFNPEYDTFDDESAPQSHETVASYQMNDKNIDQSDFENASQTPADDTIGIKGSFACAQVYSEEQSKVDDDSFCSVISVEAEKPEAQQEQVLNYQDYEECFQPECVALSDDTTYLPESEQCSLRNILLGSSDLSQPEDVPREFSDEISSGLESHEALGFFKGATAPNVGTVLQSGIQNVDSIEKSDILDTSPEDDRYDYKSHESKSQNVYEVHEAQKYEVILVSDEETAIELVGQSINQLQIGYQDHSVQESEITADKDLYLHQEGAMNMFQFGDSVQIPNSVPSGDEDKQSTPSFDTPAHRFFSKAGDHEGSSTSSLQEFENLETEMGAGRSSRTSSDSYDRAPVTRSGEHDDISMCSLNEFEKLEQDCVEAEQVDQIESEIVGMLSEIEEGHESQASDGQETISDDGHDQGSDNSDDYEKRMIEIDEIIRMAQNNVEKFHDEVLDDLSEGATLEFTVTQGIQALGGNSTEHSIVNHSACQKNFSEADSLTSVTNESFSMLKDETDTNSSSKHGAGKFTLPVSNVEEFTEQLFGVSHNVTEFLATESSKLLETDKSCILENQELLSGLRTDEQHIEEEAMEILAFDSIKSGNDTNSILWAEKIRLYQGVEDSEILPDFLETDNGTGGGQDSSSSGEKNSCSGKGDCMVSSTDSIDPSSSTATHATYQFETDSVMSSSINSAQASGEECTMVSSTDTLEPEPKLSYSQGELIDEETTSSDGMISNVNCLKMSCFESESPSNISSATQIEKLECRDQSENSKYDVHEKVAGFLEKNDEMFENPEHISYDEGHSGFSNLESESDILHVCEMYKFEDNRDAIICEEVLSKQSQKLITSLIPEKTDSLEEVKDCLEKLADELQENVKDSIPERLTENPSLIEKNILSNNDQPFPLDSYPHPISSASKSLHYPAPCDLSSLSSEMIQPQAPAFGFFQPGR